MDQLKSLIKVLEALSEDNDLKKFLIICDEPDGSTLVKVRFTKIKPSSKNEEQKESKLPVIFKRQSDKQTKRYYDRKHTNTPKLPKTGYNTRSKAKNSVEIEQPRMDDSAQSETVPISPEMPTSKGPLISVDAENVCLSNSSMCDTSSPPIPKQPQSNGPVTRNTTKPTNNKAKIYAPTNFRNVVPVNSLFDDDPSDHECDLKDFEDNTVPCLDCHLVRFPRSYCPHQRMYSCFDCEKTLFKEHNAECYKTHELILKSFGSVIT